MNAQRNLKTSFELILKQTRLSMDYSQQSCGNKSQLEGLCFLVHKTIKKFLLQNSPEYRRDCSRKCCCVEDLMGRLGSQQILETARLANYTLHRTTLICLGGARKVWHLSTYKCWFALSSSPIALHSGLCYALAGPH